jgi:hypothetical protein
MMIAYDKIRRVTVDSETGDYLDIVQSHYSIPEKTMCLFNKDREGLLVVELDPEGSTVTSTPKGNVLFKKWTLKRAFVPSKIYPPIDFEVPQSLIDRLVIFLKSEAETHFDWAASPNLNLSTRDKMRETRNEWQSYSRCIFEHVWSFGDSAFYYLVSCRLNRMHAATHS